MVLFIFLHLLIVVIALLVNSLTVYHFLKFRYEGDSSKIIVIVFIMLFVTLVALPFFLFDYSSQQQSILEKLIS